MKITPKMISDNMSDYYKQSRGDLAGLEKHTRGHWRSIILEEAGEVFSELGTKPSKPINWLKAALELSDVWYGVISGLSGEDATYNAELCSVEFSKGYRGSRDVIHEGALLNIAAATVVLDVGDAWHVLKPILRMMHSLHLTPIEFFALGRWKSALAQRRRVGRSKVTNYHGKVIRDDAALAMYLGERNLTEDYHRVDVDAMLEILLREIH